MSSEDEYYNDRYDYRNDRYSSKKTRRRGSSPRRHRFDSDFFYRKGRRSKHRNGSNLPRIVAIIILFILISYEAVVLSSPSHSKRTSIVQESNEERTATQKSSSLHTSSAAGRSDSQSSSAKTTAESPTGSTSKMGTNSGGSTSAAVPDKTVRSVPSTSNTKSPSIRNANSNPPNNKPAPKTASHHLPQSAIKLEMKGADEDPDADPRPSRRRGLPHSTTGTRRGSETDNSKTESAADRGAEPGAGENFWNWFQEAKGSETTGASKSLACPEDHKRLCQMLYKYLRKYKIRRIFDVSCEKNYEWMGDILKKVGNELWGFKYYCSLWSGEKEQEARRILGGLPFVEFDDAKWWRAGFASDTELLFAWDTLAHLAYGRVWNFFVKARKQDIKYILVDNYPGILNDPSPKRDYLNLRKHPFRFPSAKEVAQNVTEPGETSKRQLLFYETAMLPENLQ